MKLRDDEYGNSGFPDPFLRRVTTLQTVPIPKKTFQRTKSTTMICMAFEVIVFGTIRILATNGDHDAGRYELRGKRVDG